MEQAGWSPQLTEAATGVLKSTEGVSEGESVGKGEGEGEGMLAEGDNEGGKEGNDEGRDETATRIIEHEYESEDEGGNGSVKEENGIGQKGLRLGRAGDGVGDSFDEAYDYGDFEYMPVVNWDKADHDFM